VNRRFAEEARQAEEELDPDKVANDITGSNPIVEELRGSREYEKALLDQGWHEENCGISVRSKKSWKDERKEVVDIHTFDFLLFDIIEAELVFWKHYYSYLDDEEFIEDVLDSAEGSGNNPRFSGSAVNIVETFLWLRDEIDAPTEHESQQKGVDAFA
jgi:hypothetical protein